MRKGKSSRYMNLCPPASDAFHAGIPKGRQPIFGGRVILPHKTEWPWMPILGDRAKFAIGSSMIVIGWHGGLTFSEWPAAKMDEQGFGHAINQPWN
jgi:hypothetical protein